jgi:hypothetical protein
VTSQCRLLPSLRRNAGKYEWSFEMLHRPSEQIT